MHEWSVAPDFEKASVAAATFLKQQILSTVEQRGECHVALPGGNTPARCLELLAEENLPWDNIFWYLGDERCYPQGHEDRNDVMLEKNLWSKIPLSNNYVSHTYPIPAELGPELAAKAYQEIIENILPLDIVFLGMGEDGHTASLFPDNPGLQNSASVIPVHNAPKPPVDRVSLGLETLKKAECRMVLAVGDSKFGVITEIKRGTNLPINAIGDIHWFVDRAAVE